MIGKTFCGFRKSKIVNNDQSDYKANTKHRFLCYMCLDKRQKPKLFSFERDCSLLLDFIVAQHRVTSGMGETRCVSAKGTVRSLWWCRVVFIINLVASAIGRTHSIRDYLFRPTVECNCIRSIGNNITSKWEISKCCWTSEIWPFRHSSFQTDHRSMLHQFDIYGQDVESHKNTETFGLPWLSFFQACPFEWH